MMNIIEEIKDKVKPELNHIYTEPPIIESNGFRDGGWFCREHAIHIYVLARMLNFPSKILLGDFVVVPPDGRGTSSLKSSKGHAWCSVGDYVPVDVSINLEFMFPKAPQIPLVFGEHNSAPYDIEYFRNMEPDAVLEACSGKLSIIAYNEVDDLSPDPINLLNDPFQFLYLPPFGSPKLTEIYGEDYFFQVTQHCYKLITGQARPLHSYRDPKSACRAMISHNLDARSSITKTLQEKL